MKTIFKHIQKLLEKIFSNGHDEVVIQHLTKLHEGLGELRGLVLIVKEEHGKKLDVLSCDMNCLRAKVEDINLRLTREEVRREEEEKKRFCVHQNSTW
jgi:hypothetical protein